MYCSYSIDRDPCVHCTSADSSSAPSSSSSLLTYEFRQTSLSQTFTFGQLLMSWDPNNFCHESDKCPLMHAPWGFWKKTLAFISVDRITTSQKLTQVPVGRESKGWRNLEAHPIFPPSQLVLPPLWQPHTLPVKGGDLNMLMASIRGFYRSTVASPRIFFPQLCLLFIYQLLLTIAAQFAQRLMTWAQRTPKPSGVVWHFNTNSWRTVQKKESVTLKNKTLCVVVFRLLIAEHDK